MRPTHKNHPCTLWVMESVCNYKRLADLALCVCKEYTKRYGKIHSLESTIHALQSPPHGLPVTQTMTPHAVVMPEQYHHKNPVKAYRTYYLLDKVRFAKRKNTKRPYWFTASNI